MPTRALYDRWISVRDAFANCPALHAGQRSWTFKELDEAAAHIKLAAGTPVFPQGSGPEFILSVLAAWRSDSLVVPLEKDADQPHVANPPLECAQLKQTSATGGKRKYVKFTVTQLEADAANIVASMGLRPEWPNLGVISLAHSYGFSNLVLPLLLHGIPLRLVETPLPEALAQAAALGEHWTLAAVPALWRVWAEARVIPANIKLAISAGAPLPLPLEQQVCDAFGLKIHNFYGSTECGGIAYDRTSSPRRDASEIGQVMAGVQVAINSGGCLEVRGAAVGQGYWPEPELQLANGIFITSDLAMIKNGTVSLLGRSADTINLAGRKVLPEEIERVILAHPAIADCVVFGISENDPLRNEVLIAAVVRKQHAECAAKDLRAHVQQRLPAWQTPREWWFVPALETNVRGKRARSEWRERYLASQKQLRQAAP